MLKKSPKFKKNPVSSDFMSGFGLVELIIVVAIVMTSVVGFYGLEFSALKLLRSEKENLEASLLAQESLEAVRLVRDESWSGISSLAINTPYYPVFFAGKWNLASTSPGMINDKYSRLVILEEVKRNSQGQIDSDGTIDSSSRKITAKVTWSSQNGNKQTELKTYLTNFQGSLYKP